jgi:RPA family protein
MEGAARVFAGEYGGSTLSVQDQDSGSPAWVVTPGGAWCRLLFLSGALTEVAEIGDMVHTRIADPTGVFNLVIGGRRTALAETFCRLPVPVFVTVTGRAQMYKKNGEVMLSVRPDNLLVVDRLVRDQWVLATAKSTLARLHHMHLAIQGTCADERFLVAVRHYSMTKKHLHDLAAMAENAVQTVRLPECDTPVPPDVCTLVIEIIRAGSGPRGIAVDDIIKQAAICGISQESILSAIESLIIDDECYQPQKGFVKLL